MTFRLLHAVGLIAAVAVALGCSEKTKKPKPDMGQTDSGAGGDGGTGGDGGMVGDMGMQPEDDMGGGGMGGGGVATQAFGEACSTPDDCNSDSDNWPACLNEQCLTGDCTTGIGSSQGYCTRSCEADFACANASDGPYGSEFVCLSNGPDGVCSPGSSERCDGPANGACEDENEICNFQLIYATGTTYGGACQPKLEGGLPIGAACDDELLCESNICLFGRCSTFCDPEAEENLCSEEQGCIGGLDIGGGDGRLLIDICGPKSCESATDCPGELICRLTLDFAGAPFIIGICVDPDDDPTAVSAGENCDDDPDSANPQPCDGGICFGDGADSYCSVLCEEDNDCVDGACTLINLGIGEGRSAPTRLCLPASPGSNRSCAVNADCAADGEFPDEACDYIVRGDIENGRLQSPPRADGRCIEIQEDAVAFGEECTDNNPCTNESLCLTLTGSATPFCSAPCRNTPDCGEGAYCSPLRFSDNGTQADPSDDLFVGVCFADEASHAECVIDSDCPDGSEFCNYNVLIGAEGAAVEKICIGGVGAAGPGEACGTHRDCKSNDCQPWSRVLGTEGYCRGACVVDTDCSEDGSITCEQHLIFDLDPESPDDNITAGYCVPSHVCGRCDFSGSRLCGGDLACSQVTFPVDNGTRYGNACLPTCNPDAADCAEGYTCGAARNDTSIDDTEGEEIPGMFVCIPDAPNDTCLDARPRR